MKSVDEVTRKPVVIDFLYLDLKTCERCVATGDTLDEALEALAPALKVMSYAVKVNRVNIVTPALAEQYRFVSSPTIRVNGVDICTELRQSHCQDCSDLSGCSTDCRVFVFDQQEYEQPPASMIAHGILEVLTRRETAPVPVDYVMPENIANYFTGRGTTMRTISVFEPALCCNTGVCGPDPAQELIDFTADVGFLKVRGVDIARHNLASDPTLFAHTDVIRDFMQVAGSDGLPVTVVDGAIVLTGHYPTRSELSRYAGLADVEAIPVAATASGCGCDCGCEC